MIRSSISLRPIYRNLRIRHKIFLLVMLIMSCSFAATYAALQYAYGVYDKQLYETSSKVLSLSSNLIESELRKVASVSFNVASDPDIQLGLKKLKSNAASDYDKLVIRATIETRLMQYAGNQPYVYSIEVVDMNEGVYSAGKRGTTDKLRNVILTAAEGAGEKRWMYPDEEDPSLALVKQILSYENTNIGLEPIGTLMIRFKMDNIVSDSLSGTGIRSGEMVISSDGGGVIYPMGGEALSAGAADRMYNGSPSYEIKQIGGSRYFVTYSKSLSSGWLYRNMMPFDPIFNRIIWMKRMLLILFPASVLIVIAIALSFAGSITRPIESLISKMKRVQSGQFQTLILEETTPSQAQAVDMDEVGQLQRTFRMMLRQIDELISENYKKQLTIKETQFQALQAQINPHFLYNTLDSINWLAKVNKQEAISRMVEALGYLFRHSISLTDTLVTIDQELSIALHYVTIQRYRFQDRLLFRADIAEEYRSKPIPKLTLQPLLENAIHYGLEPLIGPCSITIRAYEEKGRLAVVVEDDGQGMDPERLDQVRRGDYVSAGRGIGLTNIDERIKLAFGDEYGVRIESSLGAGTKVYVILPL